MQAELNGFKTAVVPRVEVGVDSQTPVEFILEVGQLTDEVTVTGGATLLTTDRADVAMRFDSRQLTDLPVLDRNFTKFLLLTPGTQQLQWQHAASENPQGSTQTMVNGQHFSGTNYQLDGTDNRDPILGIIVINPTLESVGDTKITSQNYDAEFGLAVAGVVSVQTRSGTNSLRGSAFEFFQNAALQARNPFTQFQPDPLTGRFIPETKRNQFGASVGGPIVQNRWFYFGDYQGTRATQGGSRLLSVPTAAARAGDLSAYGVNIYDPQTGQQFDGNRIPTGRLSQQAQRILDLIPTPNATGRDNGTRDNYVAAASEIVRRELDERPDRWAAVGQAQHLRPLQPRRLLPQRSDLVRAGRRPGAGQPRWRLGRPQPQPRLRHGLHGVADDARRLPVRVLPVQGQRAAVRLRHHAGGRRRDSRSEHRLDVRLGTACGFRRRRRTRRNRARSSSGRVLASTAATVPLDQDEKQLQMVGNITKMQGNHTLKFGMDVRRAYNLRVPSDAHRSGELTFASDRTSLSGAGGLGLATFLIGDVTQLRRYVSANTDARERQWRHFYYAQDTWRVNSRTTLTYGLRLDIINPQTINDAGQCRVPRPEHWRDRGRRYRGYSAERRRREQAELGAARGRDSPDH